MTATISNKILTLALAAALLLPGALVTFEPGSPDRRVEPTPTIN